MTHRTVRSGGGRRLFSTLLAVSLAGATALVVGGCEFQPRMGDMRTDFDTSSAIGSARKTANWMGMDLSTYDGGDPVAIARIDALLQRASALLDEADALEADMQAAKEANRKAQDAYYAEAPSRATKLQRDAEALQREWTAFSREYRVDGAPPPRTS